MVQNKSWFKNFWSKKRFFVQNQFFVEFFSKLQETLEAKIFSVEKYFLDENIFQKEFFVKNNFWSKRTLGRKNFWLKKHFGSEKILVEKRFRSKNVALKENLALYMPRFNFDCPQKSDVSNFQKAKS